MLMTRAHTPGISPFFIVSNVDQTIAFYCKKLGFEKRFQEPDRNPFFAILGRDGAQLFVKSDKAVLPLPNSKRHPFMRWDAYVYAPDPDALAAEFADHGAAFSTPLKDTQDGLRGFEIRDPDGYVLFFGRPRWPGPSISGITSRSACAVVRAYGERKSCSVFELALLYVHANKYTNVNCSTWNTNRSSHRGPGQEGMQEGREARPPGRPGLIVKNRCRNPRLCNRRQYGRVRSTSDRRCRGER